MERCLRELPVTRVVEFGTGQSSLLIDRLISHDNLPVSVTSFEQDSFWADTIAKKVRHQVGHAPLVDTVVDGHNVMFYDNACFDQVGLADLVLVDGPTAYAPNSQYNRLGVMNFLRQHLGTEFIVIFDDCERRGDATAANCCRALLEERGITFFQNTVKAAKQQRVFCTSKFRAAAYF